MKRAADAPTQQNVKTVLVYGMGCDGSAPVFESLNATDGVHVRQVHTLDRTKVTNIMLRDADDTPAHILESDRILREELGDDTPFYLITLVHNPLERHIRQAYAHLQQALTPEDLVYAVTNARMMVNFFSALPISKTTQWFEKEYKPATGIDVFDAKYNPKKGFIDFTIGANRLLILSAHLSQDDQTRVLSEFLGVKIVPVQLDTATDDLYDIFAGHIIAHSTDVLRQGFWDARETQCFFTSKQIDTFKKQANALAARIMARPDMKDTAAVAGTREDLLQSAISPLFQTSHLIAELDTMNGKYGMESALANADSVLRQLDRARDSILLATMRMNATQDIAQAITFGESWINTTQDERIARALSGLHQRNGAIYRPLALLSGIPGFDVRVHAEKQKLESQRWLLESGYGFSQRGRTLFEPAAQSVLYNAHQSMPFHTSGYATRTQGIVKGLKASGWNVNIVTRMGYPLDTGLAPHQDADTIDGIAYHYDTIPNRGQRDLPMENYIGYAAAYLMEHAQALRPSVIHTASNYICGLAGIEAARRLGLPSVYEMRGLWHVTRWSKDPAYIDSDQFALAQQMELQAAAGADHVLAITGALKEWLVEHGIDENKISLAPNAVDLDQFQVRMRDDNFARQTGCAGKIVIGYIGSFVQYEGLDLLIQAVAMLPRVQRDAIKLLWIGDGPALQDLLTQAEALGISDCVVSLGRRPFDEVPRAYSIVDIAVFPRKGQAVCEIISPLKPFEAMAMGKAVIVSDVRPLKEIVEHQKTGLVHEKDNAESLRHALSRMIDDEALRTACGINARAWISETRRWDVTASAISDVYKALV